jgi:hypothetical protein
MLRSIIVLPLALAAGIACAAPDAARLRTAYAQLPLHFEAAVDRGTYVARGADYTLFLAPDEAVIALAGAPGAIRATLDGASAAVITPESVLPGRSHHLHGADPAHWTHAEQFARVRYSGIYRGIDLVYYGNGDQLEYDFQVAPGSDPASIRLRYDGVDAARIDERGDLLLQAGDGTLRVRKPVSWQEIGGVRRAVESSFDLRTDAGRTEVGFALGAYDPAQALVIDPVVAWSTYLGSRKQDEAYAVAVDADGNVYVTGATRFSDFPVANAFDTYNGGDYDVFVSKISADGQTLLYSTFLGSTGFEYGTGIAVDGAGHILVSGYTSSPDFPTRNAARGYAGGGDAFLAKLTADGSALIWSTYLGGSASESGRSVAVDAQDDVYLSGLTWSTDFHGLRGFQNAFGGGAFDSYVAKFAGDTGALAFISLLGGSGEDWQAGLAVDSSGRAYLSGFTNSTDFPTAAPLQAQSAGGIDAYVARFSANGRALSYSTYLGGPGRDQALAIAVDADNIAYIGGSSDAAGFPQVSPLAGFHAPAAGGFPQKDAIIASLARDGSALRFSTYLGGALGDEVSGIALDAADNVYVTGTTSSPDFPSVNPFQDFNPSYGGTYEAFVAKLPKDGRALLFASPLGGQGYDFADAIAVDRDANLVVVGRSSGGFPVVNALYPRVKRNDDAFVARISQGADAVPDVIEFAAPLYSVVEDQDYAYVRVKRTGSGYGSVLARITASGGTATAGSDYIVDNWAASFGHGKTGLLRIPIRVLHDQAFDEPDETLRLTLSPIQNGFATIGPNNTTTLRIRESTAPVPIYVTLGTGNLIETLSPTTYRVPFSIIATNSAGNPASGATIRLSIESDEYQKGFLVYDTGSGFWYPVYNVSGGGGTFGCLNEDTNRNGILEAGEDINHDGVLEPGSVASVPASVTIDERGIGEFGVTYVKDRANWVRVRITAQVNEPYASGTVTTEFVLFGAADDFHDVDQAPPGRTSPYGTADVCSDPD